MEFKTTSIIDRRRSRHGMTLVEMLVSMGIASIVSAMILSMTLHCAKTFSAVTNYSELSQQARAAMDRMSKMIRQADMVTGYTTNSVSFVYPGGILSYTYSPGTRRLTEVNNGVQTVLLEECEALTFNVFKRNPVGGEFNYFPVNQTLSEAKLVQVNWHCGRSLMQSETHSEDIVSAKVVMRTP